MATKHSIFECQSKERLKKKFFNKTDHAFDLEKNKIQKKEERYHAYDQRKKVRKQDLD